MYLGTLTDREEALRTLEFLRSNGIRVIAEEGSLGGQTAYRLVTMLGIAGQGFKTNPERIAHDTRIFELGERWVSEHRGQLDFSRTSQIQWDKYEP
jgi:hypothetical protein